jgi:hypothetical protein
MWLIKGSFNWIPCTYNKPHHLLIRTVHSKIFFSICVACFRLAARQQHFPCFAPRCVPATFAPISKSSHARYPCRLFVPPRVVSLSTRSPPPELWLMHWGCIHRLGGAQPPDVAAPSLTWGSSPSQTMLPPMVCNKYHRSSSIPAASEQ